ncbi:MAG TPA: hypothetical protein PLY83_04160, partial [Synergistales bacterium]|nr:hypothetical protein [Synergistales bacterium]
MIKRKRSSSGFARMPREAGGQEPIGLISRRAWGELDFERARQRHLLLGGNAPPSGIFPSTDFLPFFAFLVHSPAAFLIVEELHRDLQGKTRKTRNCEAIWYASAEPSKALLVERVLPLRKRGLIEISNGNVVRYEA